LTCDLVLEGGGVKGIGLVGAAARIRQDYDVARVAGTSVGALVAALVAAGYTPDEMRAEMAEFEFTKVPHPDLLDRIPVVGPLTSAVWQRGVYETTWVRDWLALRLAAKGVRTFADLRMPDEDSSLPPAKRYRLVVTATDVTSGELRYLPWDYDRYGLKADEQSVADAVAASIAIPFYFEPITVMNARTGRRHTLVDGGVLSNFPITVFDRTDAVEPRWPTFGIKIIPRLPEGNSELLPGLGFLPVPGVRHLEAVIATIVVGRDQTTLSEPGVAARTMQVDTTGVGVVEFDIPDDKRDRLLAEGKATAERFLAGWDFEDYKRRYRPLPT
jgi:NTE family protein